MRGLKNILRFSILMGVCTLAFSQQPLSRNESPLGKWITMDRATQKPTGIVEITESAGHLTGKIVHGFKVDQVKFCHHCTGSQKDKPVIGLTFLWDFLPSGNHTWTGGYVLDPHDGAIYHAKLLLSENGNKLQLRGYWGVFFRTETWVRKNA